jgi:hypothetical protein
LIKKTFVSEDVAGKPQKQTGRPKAARFFVAETMEFYTLTSFTLVS